MSEAGSRETTESSKPKKGGKQLFKKGESGNPAGKPPGTKNRSTLIKAAIEGQMVERLERDAVSVLEKTIEMAMAGDTTCIKILMDRLLPARKAQDDSGHAKGTGGINIVIQSMPKEKTIINGTTVEDNDG